jgi:nucleoside-diphosphate-sugar epimerase
MTLLVTGAMGHVGYEVVRQGAQRGMPVLALYRGTFDEARARAAGADVQWVQCDLTDAAAVSALADAHRIDACIHSAAISNEAYARPAPLLAVAGNVAATASILECARTKSWRRFLLVSTDPVFQMRADTKSPIL